MMGVFKKPSRESLYSKENMNEHPYNKTLHQLFEEQVERTPNNTAVIGPPIDGNAGTKLTLTYQQLNERSNQLAYFLRSRGVGPDVIVGIMAERSLEMIVGLLGILKAGGAYLPISPKNPGKRVAHLLNDSEVKILLIQESDQKSISDFLTGVEVIDINLDNSSIFRGPKANLHHINRPGDLVYVIYTSGSTGKPKGVMIQHISLVNRLNWMQKKYPLSENDMILQKTPFFFDVSVWELFWWSLVGAKMCFLISGGEKFPQAIVQTIEDNKVTVLHFVPSMLSVFLDYLKHSIEDIRRLGSLKQVFASGEILTPSHVQSFYQIFSENNLQLSNLYGPTEATVDVTYYDCLSKGNLEKIPIGKAIDNIDLMILDENHNPVDIGERGELFIGGVGVARGYLNRPELTSDSFSNDFFSFYEPNNNEKNNGVISKNILTKSIKCFDQTFSKGGRRPQPINGIGICYKQDNVNNFSISNIGNQFYKTGDDACWFPDGNIDFLGRRDNQVKIHGLRIEIGEIESALSQHPSIRGCVVLVKQYSKRITLLIGYIIPLKELTIKELKDFLKMTLPEYMVPNLFIFMKEFPLTPNGKIDRKKLPEPKFS